MPAAPTHAPPRLLPLVVATLLCPSSLAAEPAGKAKNPAPPKPDVLTATTSDGVAISTWVYPAPGEEPALATVLLLHDLGGSHATLEPLAQALQAGGCSVVAPDLRGHGRSLISRLERVAGEGGQADLLKGPDFMAMAATAGGRLRDQAAVQGDLESVRGLIKQKADGVKLDLEKLFVVGSGLGAAVAAGWTVGDAAWPPTTSGPQGATVRGLVMVDPAFSIKGFSIVKALGGEPLKTTLPLMIIAGGEDRDAVKVFDHLKRGRPKSWFDNRLVDKETRRNTSPAKDSEASLLFIKLGGRLAGDDLAAARATDGRSRDPASLILTFIGATSGRERNR